MKKFLIYLALALSFVGAPALVPQQSAATAQVVVNSYVFASQYDTDAQTYFTANSGLNTTQKDAVNALVVSLKTSGIWAKCYAIYPFVGGTASSHKWNLKDPRDLDAAYRLVFYGGWTHSSTGALPNGSTGYADTYLVPSSVMSQNSKHLSYHSRTATSDTQGLMGGLSSGSGDILSPSLNGAGYNGLSAAAAARTAITGAGFHLVSRSSSTQMYSAKNGAVLDSWSSTSTMNYSSSYVLGAFRETGISWYSTHECIFASIGQGLTPTEISNFNAAVQAYKTALSR